MKIIHRDYELGLFKGLQIKTIDGLHVADWNDVT